ncbi:hypothetical protein G0D83_13140 [Yangia sp. PrR003]|nr:hypothetical protein [Salipiger sp. PrR003]
MIYALYFVGFFFPITALGGVIYAFIAKGDSPELDTHMSFAIRTFMWGLLITFIGAILAFFLIGWFVLLGWAIWTIARCVSGLKLAMDGKPITEVGSMGFVAR